MRNVLIDSLASRLVDMSAAWNRFTQRRDFKALGLLGWLRVLEVTRNAHTATYHPHFHAVLVVPSGCWLPEHSWWLRCWQLAARDESIMFVNLRVVDGSKSSIEEVSKYVVKDSDFPGRLGYLSFHNSIRRLLMSVVFLLLAAGVTLAARWVLLTQIRIP